MTLHLIVAAEPSRSFAALALAGLLTYLIHSAIWGGAAALFARSRAFSPATQSYLWLAALLGPVLTSAFSVASSSSAHYEKDLEVTLAGPASLARSAGTLQDVVLLVLITATALGGLRFGLTLLAWRRRLRDRTPVLNACLIERLNHLRDRTRLRAVTLTQSTALQVPLVLGRSEICLPADHLRDASISEIDAVLAHELAHLVRRDGVVFPLVGLVQSLGWLQPFNHWIAAGFRHAAELACDDRAIELTGDRVALARALARAAQAAVPMLPAMARPRAKSALVERVRRLVAVQERTRSHVRSGWAVVCCAALAAGTVGVSVRAARPAVADASDASATEQIADLMAHAERVERELATLQSVAGHAEPRVLNLQQELRHVRETAAWIERRSSGQASP